MQATLLHETGGKIVPPLSTAPFIGFASPRNDRSLMAEADHRIGNHLALLTAYVHLKAADLARQPAEPSRASMGLLLQGVGAQVTAISRLHRALANDGSGVSADLGDFLHDICASFTDGLSGAAKLTENFAPGCVVRPEQALALGRIVSEVITNAIKYGHDGETIIVHCCQDSAGAVLIEIVDDGPGLPEAFDPLTDGGLGFRLLRRLGEQLGALITFQSTDTGLRFRLTLPADK